MTRKKVRLDLSPGSFDEAIRNVNALQKCIVDGTRVLVEQMTERGENMAAQGFATADYYEASRDATVTSEISNDGHSGKVIAIGKDVLFIEFGTGLNAGSEDPLSAKYYPTSYSLTVGNHWLENKDYWYWKRQRYHGVNAAMCMYRAKQDLTSNWKSMARGVYKW